MDKACALLIEYGRVTVEYQRGRKYMAVRIRAWVKHIVDADTLRQAYGGTFATRVNGCLWTASNKECVAAAASDMHRYGGERMKALANMLARYAQSKRGRTTRFAKSVMDVLECRSVKLKNITEADESTTSVTSS